jgi:NADH-quinone oxidoreductase subunit N
LWLPIFVLITTSTIGVYYYLRVIVALFSSPAEDRERERVVRLTVPLEASFGLSALTILLFVFGIYPTPLWALIQTVSASLR